MSTDFVNMLYLFGASATGKEIKTQYCQNLSKIRKLALSQEVWDVVYAGVREKIATGEITVPPEVYARLEKNFMSNVAMNIRRVEFNLGTLRRLEEKGIKCCVLKGTTVARLYAMPEARISSDIDILIDAANEKQTVEILEGLGYRCENRAKHDHHMKAFHEIGGLLEVHVALHSVPTNDIILDDEIRYNEEFMLLDNGVYSLGVNDTLTYLSAHLIKHLINDATGVRQMMDLLLYMKAYESQIDWDKYNYLMKKLGYDNLIAVVKGIGVKYFGMEFDDAITQGSGLEELLDDCEIGGAFGYGEKDRAQFYDMYTKRRSGKSPLQHLLYRLFTAERSLFSLLFPPARAIKERFAYVQRYPILLPVGWAHRFLDIFLKTSGKVKADENEESRVKNNMLERRMKMVEKLGMLKNGEN